ncbi:MAG: sigma-70 family RNA polymerase sigma factor [Planctomycetes bacterium]|nr:sigma-70 family RNA polymerase sigma factor [Planctomycetota bacterium]
MGLAAILAGVAAGDAAAWEALVIGAGDEMGIVARNITGRSDLADDAVQETLLRIRARASDFTPPVSGADAAARAWVRQVTANATLRMLRARQRANAREQRAAAERGDTYVDQVSEGLHHQELSAALDMALADLSEANRRAVILHHQAGLTIGEVADQLLISDETAKKRVHRGMLGLRRRLRHLRQVLGLSAIAAWFGRGHTADAVGLPSRLERLRSWRVASGACLIGVVAIVLVFSHPDRRQAIAPEGATPSRNTPASRLGAATIASERAGVAESISIGSIADNDAWIADGDLIIDRQSDRVRFTSERGSEPTSHPRTARLLHHRVWDLTDSPVMLQADIQVEQGDYYFDLNASLSPGLDQAENWQHPREVRMLFQGSALAIVIQGTPDGPLAMSMGIFETVGYGNPRTPVYCVNAPLRGLGPGRHRCDLLIASDAYRARIDGDVVYQGRYQVGVPARRARFTISVIARELRPAWSVVVDRVDLRSATWPETD